MKQQNKTKNRTISIFLLFTITTLLLSGCSNNQNGTSFLGTIFQRDSVPETDQTGKGLEIDFKIEEDWTYKGQVRYSINLKNTGIKTLKLTKDNIKLTTRDKTEDTQIFTEKSINEFYATIFQNKEITLYHDQNTETIQGSLYVNEKFFNESTNEKFEYILETNYEYETEFNTNIELTLDKQTLMTPLDKIQQAAPVIINKIELLAYQGDEYTIKYYFKDNGPQSITNNEKTIKIPQETLKLKFRKEELNINDCKAFHQENENLKEISTDRMQISSENKELILACKINLKDINKNQKTTTTTSGSFKYEYKLSQEGTINLPEKRNSQINWD